MPDYKSDCALWSLYLILQCISIVEIPLDLKRLSWLQIAYHSLKKLKSHFPPVLSIKHLKYQPGFHRFTNQFPRKPLQPCGWQCHSSVAQASESSVALLSYLYRRWSLHTQPSKLVGSAFKIQPVWPPVTSLVWGTTMIAVGFFWFSMLSPSHAPFCAQPSF